MAAGASIAATTSGCSRANRTSSSRSRQTATASITRTFCSVLFGFTLDVCRAAVACDRGHAQVPRDAAGRALDPTRAALEVERAELVRDTVFDVLANDEVLRSTEIGNASDLEELKAKHAGKVQCACCVRTHCRQFVWGENNFIRYFGLRAGFNAIFVSYASVAPFLHSGVLSGEASTEHWNASARWPAHSACTTVLISFSCGAKVTWTWPNA